MRTRRPRARKCRIGESLVIKSAKNSNTSITTHRRFRRELDPSARSQWLTLCSSQRLISKTKMTWLRAHLHSRVYLLTCRKATTTRTLWKAKARARRHKKRSAFTYRRTTSITQMIGAIANTSCHRLIRHHRRAKLAIRQVKLRSLSLDYLKRAWICRHQVPQLCSHPAQKHASKTQLSPSDNKPSTVVCSSSLERAQTRPLPGLNPRSSQPPKASSNAVLLFKIGLATLSRCSRPVLLNSLLTQQKMKTPTPKKSLM